MSNVIEFLERLGRDAHWRHATDDAREAVLMQAGFEPSVRAAILGEDPSALESLVGARPNICCLINHPEDEEEKRKEVGDEDDEKSDDKDDELEEDEDDE